MWETMGVVASVFGIGMVMGFAVGMLVWDEYISGNWDMELEEFDEYLEVEWSRIWLIKQRIYGINWWLCSRYFIKKVNGFLHNH